jgi:hypothetical protein
VTGPHEDPFRAVDPLGFARRLERLTSSAPRPWEHVGKLLEIAHTAGIAGVLESLGPRVARVDPIGIELTATLEGPGGWQRARLIAVDDGARAGAELEAQGWTVVATRVQMEAASRPAGVVVLAFRVNR